MLYLLTIRYLRISQIFYRVIRYIHKPKKIDIFLNLSNQRANLIDPPRNRDSLCNNTHFNFLNQSVKINTSWFYPKQSKLWNYNIHYFDFLNTINGLKSKQKCQKLMSDWVKKNNYGENPAWDPYPTSLRIVNWIFWHLKGNTLDENLIRSLSQQSFWLSRRLEFHIMGNHLFANGKALVFAGLFFSGEKGIKFLSLGLKIVNSELKEQVLEDGGHIERSPMYHSIILKDLLDLLNLANLYKGKISKYSIRLWRDKAKAMLFWIKNMTHPDGEIAFFNDAAFGIAIRPEELISYAKRLGIEDIKTQKKIQYQASSGYAKINKDNYFAIIDIAKIGPDYQPGHAHADSLSFELSIFGKRVFINGGTSLYESGEIRDYERGTSSHNTVAVNGENSSEVWSSFRVARRAYPFNIDFNEKKDSVIISCAHNGYKRLKGKPIHVRKWIFTDDEIIIKDQIQGRFNNATAYFHLHPSISLLRASDSACFFQLNNGREIKLGITNGDMSIKDSFYSPEFGIRKKTKCLAVDLVNGKSELKVSLFQ